MPIRIPNDLPAAEILQQENIFVMPQTRAVSQDIRPLEIVLLNLMPTKIATETQFSRLLGNTPLQVHLELMHTTSHKAKNISQDHLFSFYKEHPEKMSEEYVDMLENRGEALEDVVCDYISGMTDQYAIQKFQEYFVPRSWS